MSCRAVPGLSDRKADLHANHSIFRYQSGGHQFGCRRQWLRGRYGAPLKPQEITYGTALVDGVNVQTGAQGAVSQINDVSQGGFSPQAIRDLSNPARDLAILALRRENGDTAAYSREHPDEID